MAVGTSGSLGTPARVGGAWRTFKSAHQDRTEHDEQAKDKYPGDYTGDHLPRPATLQLFPHQDVDRLRQARTHGLVTLDPSGLNLEAETT
jgi:hypothetical protein